MTRYDFPRIDLHLHLDGSMLPDTAWALAAERGVALPADSPEGLRRYIAETTDCASVNEYLKRFELPLQLMQDAAALSRVTADLIGELAAQGLRYAEIRFAPQLHTRRGLTQREAVEAVLAGRSAGMALHPGIGTGILLCAMSVGPETVNMDANLETVRLAREYLGRGVAGIDLAGAEGIVPLRNFAPVFELARAQGVPFTCHAGDSQGPETVRDALDFGAKRIGHGHHIIQNRELCLRAIREGVTLEICPTSNIQCHTEPSYEEHPAKTLLDMGVAVTINTDNMVLADVTLDREYDHCLEQMGFSYDDLIHMNMNSVRASFMPEADKAPILRELEQAM